jgi:hypothetical protein
MTMIDFRGRDICEACWNGHHYIFKRTKAGKKTNTKISNCQQTIGKTTKQCECECRALLAEQKDRRAKAMLDNLMKGVA